MMRRTGRWVLAVVAALVLAIALAPCLTRRPDDKSVFAVCEDELRRHVGFLTGIEPPRSYRNPDSLERIAAYVEDHFRASGLRLENQIFRVDGTEYRNVIGTAGPRDGPRLVVGAHYDVEGDKPGADDNASGVAGLLELARWVGDLSPHLERRLDLVAYSLEEPPFFRTQEMGSHLHAARRSATRESKSPG